MSEVSLDLFINNCRYANIDWLTENLKDMPDTFPDGMSPLYHAIILRYFQYSANLLYYARFQDDCGVTALMLAAYSGQVDIAGLLIYKEAKMRNHEGKTALMMAVEANQLVIVELLSQYECNETDFSGYNASMYAKNESMREFLLYFEADKLTHEEFLKEFE